MGALHQTVIIPQQKKKTEIPSLVQLRHSPASAGAQAEGWETVLSSNAEGSFATGSASQGSLNFQTGRASALVLLHTDVIMLPPFLGAEL